MFQSQNAMQIRVLNVMTNYIIQYTVGAQVAEWLACQPLTNVAWVQFLAQDLIPVL